MNDQELARQIVAHLGGDGPNNYAAYSIVIDGIAHWMPAEKFVNDWRVAGAMLTKCHCLVLQNERSIWLAKVWATDESPRCEIADSASSPARAINEACDKALS